jgi:hypothetical protein
VRTAFYAIANICILAAYLLISKEGKSIRSFLTFLQQSMRKVFYIKDKYGEFTKMSITPSPVKEKPGSINFHISSGIFNGTIEKDENGLFHHQGDFNTELHTIINIIKRYYHDFKK